MNARFSGAARYPVHPRGMPNRAAHRLRPRHRRRGTQRAAFALLWLCLGLAAPGAANTPAADPGAGSGWTFDFQDIEVRTALKLLAEMRGLNLVAGDDVDGRITLHLENVPWEKALQLILDNRGLHRQRDGDILLVRRRGAGTGAASAADAADAPQHLPIRFADAAELAALLGQDPHSGGRVVVDVRTNALLLYGTAPWHRRMQQTVALLDVPVRQVMISAMIAVVQADHARQLGLEWQGRVGESHENTAGLLNLGAGGGGLEAALRIGFAGDHARLQLALQAMESQGLAEVISRPRLVTGNRRTASIKSGIQIPFQESAPNGRTTVQFKDAVLRLDVTPVITPGDKITLDLIINQDSPGSALQTEAGQVPTINTTELRTRILLAENETAALGGVLRNERNLSRSKTPLLGSAPLVGRLFRRSNRQHIKTETLIFITPQILPGE